MDERLRVASFLAPGKNVTFAASVAAKHLVSSADLMLKRTLLAFALYALASLGAPYIVYKNLPPSPDSQSYLELIDRPWSEVEAAAPYRYRMLTPLMARAMGWLPHPSMEIRAEDVLDPVRKRAFWNLIIVNYVQALIASTLCFYLAHAVFRFEAPTAFIGGVFFLFAYPSPANWVIVDIGAHIFILLALVCYFRQWIWAFAGVCLVGAMQKEIVFVTIGCFLVLEAFRRRAAILPWFVALAPAVLAYAALPFLWPAPVYQLDRGTIGWPNSRTIGQLFNREYLLSLAPFLASIATHIFLRLRYGVRLECPLVWLALVPILTAVSVITSAVGSDWSPSGRLTLFSYSVIMLYQLEVFEAVAVRCGWISAAVRRDPSVWAPWTSVSAAGRGASK